MESKRQTQLGRLVQRELGVLFLRNAKKWSGVNFVTISRVMVTADMSLARIYVTFMDVKEHEAPIAMIKRHIPEIKFNLGKALKNELRKLPDLTFFYDDTLDYVEKMDQLFDEINKNKLPEHGEE